MQKINSTEEYKGAKPEYTIVSLKDCPPCEAAKKLFKKYNINFEELDAGSVTDLEDKGSLTEEQQEKLDTIGYQAYPQIYTGSLEGISKENFIGGYSDLLQLPEIQNLTDSVKDSAITITIDNMNTNKAYAQEVLDSPISSAIMDIPLSKEVSDAQNGFGGGLLGITGGMVGGIVGGPIGGATGLAVGGAIGGLSTTVLGSIIEKKSRNNGSYKGFGSGMKHGGMLAASIGTGMALTSTFIGYLATVLGTYLALNILFYYLTGKKAEAQKIIENETGDSELAETFIIEMDKQGEEKVKKEMDKISNAAGVITDEVDATVTKNTKTKKIDDRTKG